MDFFKDPKDIWTAIITVYYNASQKLYQSSRGYIYFAEPKKYTSEQIEEQGVLMRANCQLYFVQKKEQNLEAVKTQLINISGNNSYDIEKDFDNFPFFSSKREEQFIKNLK
jgi:hypothetical protein